MCIVSDDKVQTVTTRLADLQRCESFCDAYLTEIQFLAHVVKNGNPNILTHQEAMKADYYE